MKSLLVRWTASLGISFGILLGMGSQNFTAYALPDGDVERILSPIPVFMVTDAEGKPLTASSQEGEQVAGVFISRSDAQSFITNLGTNNPDLARQLQVSPLPLIQIVRQARAQSSVQFEFVSMRGQVEAAQQVQQDFQGTPLFAAKAESTGGYLSITVNDRQVIPFFFEKQKLDALVNRFTQQNPNQANSIRVQVIPLEAVIDTLANSEEEGLKQIILVLSDESLQYVRSLQQQTP
ncbi:MULTISPECIES: Tic22 family protein [Spirulina sp. CCY15215]|uniref:Tic22 family protein n=1 Tax=Spirulina sp. CCY15215 TaxID=2767591 RepID=UPI001950F2F5|nr:Tic22 family protein [Spirulina major]